MLRYSFFVVFILFFVSACYASVNEYTIYTGVSYDSNVQYLSLYEKLDGDKNKEKGAFFFNNDFDGEFFFRKYGLLLDLECFTMIAPWFMNASKANLSFSLSKQFDFTEKWKTELRFENSLLGENHSSFFFSYFKSMLTATAVYRFNEYLDMYLSVNGGFATGLDSLYKYITGPMAGFEGGVFIYPGMDDDFVRVSIGNNFYLGRDERLYLAEDKIIYVNNRFLRLYLLVNGEFLFKSLLAGFSAKTEYSIWLAEDLQNYISWSKQRQEEMLSISLYLRYYFTETAAVEFFTGFESVFSNFGKKNEDYVDYNYFQVMSSLKFIFFI